MFCKDCGHDLVERSAQFSQTVKGKTVHVTMDALVCPNCDFKTVPMAQMPELMRRVADQYRSSVGLLTSDEIRQRRMALRMSQEQFAAFLHVGPASVKRWELGKIQDPSMDFLIRLGTDFYEQIKEKRPCSMSGSDILHLTTMLPPDSLPRLSESRFESERWNSIEPIESAERWAYVAPKPLRISMALGEYTAGLMISQ